MIVIGRHPREPFIGHSKGSLTFRPRGQFIESRKGGVAGGTYQHPQNNPEEDLLAHTLFRVGLPPLLPLRPLNLAPQSLPRLVGGGRPLISSTGWERR